MEPACLSKLPGRNAHHALESPLQMMGAEAHVLAHDSQCQGLIGLIISFNVAAKALDSLDLGIPDRSLFRPAAPAGPKPAYLRSLRHLEKGHLVPPGPAGRTGGTAIDACRANPIYKSTVQPVVSRQHRPPPVFFGFLIHFFLSLETCLFIYNIEQDSSGCYPILALKLYCRRRIKKWVNFNTVHMGRSC
jgi:hypothetical protein